MRVISEERLNPVENVVKDVEHGIFSDKRAVANTINAFEKSVRI